MESAVRRPSGRVAKATPHKTSESGVEAQARSELLGSTYRCLRHVACYIRDGVLTLRGHVPTYFHKQVAQTVVRRCLDGSVTIDNWLRVVGTGS